MGFHKEVARKMAQTGVDMIWLGDDMGAQDSLMIDPELWREFFKGRMADIIRTVKEIKPDIKVAYHTDGCNYDIIPDLIEIGLDVLNPIQTECMNPEILQEKYGDQLSTSWEATISVLPVETSGMQDCRMWKDSPG
ncbi:uroporphyrinogen decarboxylase family protein [Phocaeicola coprophilus]|uniref:uroporphyrinogen decarboxylase family protein n=1 Tax=Phocaeicola coprophilus TaxID=387090 RepID=UPI00241F4858|nr:uroporphyrinogen decarboxylase family protein [Phocaeicola coprophilus]